MAQDERQNAVEQALISWKRDRVWQDIQHFSGLHTFWEALSCIMPDWKVRKANLEFWESEAIGVTL